MSDNFAPTPDTALGPLNEDWKFFLANLPYQATPQDIRDHFQQFGVVNFCKLIYDTKTGKSRGYGFLYMNDAQGDDAVGHYMRSNDHRFTFMGKPRVFLTRNDKEKSMAAAANQSGSRRRDDRGSYHSHHDHRDSFDQTTARGGDGPPPHRGSRDNNYNRRGSSYDERPERDFVEDPRFDAQNYDDRRHHHLPPQPQGEDRSHQHRHRPEDDRYSNYNPDYGQRDESGRPYDDGSRNDNYYPPNDDYNHHNNPRDGRAGQPHHHDSNHNTYQREDSLGPPANNGHRPENGGGHGREEQYYRDHRSNSRSNHNGYHDRHHDDVPHRSNHNESLAPRDARPSHRNDRYLDASPPRPSSSSSLQRPPPPHFDDRGPPNRYNDHGAPPIQQRQPSPPSRGGNFYHPRDDQRPPSPPPPQFFRPRSASPPPPSPPPPYNIDSGGRFHHPLMDPPPPSTVVVLENLPFEITAREISLMLNDQHAMNVRRCTLEYDGEIGQQYAVVTLSSEDEVRRCLDLSFRYLLLFQGREVVARREGNGGPDTTMLVANHEPPRDRDYPVGPPARPMSPPPPHESSRPLPPPRWNGAEDSDRRSNSNNNHYPSRNYHPRGDGGGSGRPGREQRRDRPY